MRQIYVIKRKVLTNYVLKTKKPPFQAVFNMFNYN
jgi:hypothetical protein